MIEPTVVKNKQTSVAKRKSVSANKQVGPV